MTSSTHGLEFHVHARTLDATLAKIVLLTSPTHGFGFHVHTRTLATVPPVNDDVLLTGHMQYAVCLHTRLGVTKH